MRYFIFIIIVALISGCATYKKPVQKTYNKSQVFNMEYDKVWNLIVEWFASNGTPIKNIDKSSGLISSEYNLSLKNSGDCYDCGEPGFGQRLQKPKGELNIIVRRTEDGKVKVTVNMFINTILETASLDANSPPYKSEVPCLSTGLLENEIFTYLSNN